MQTCRAPCIDSGRTALRTMGSWSGNSSTAAVLSPHSAATRSSAMRMSMSPVSDLTQQAPPVCHATFSRPAAQCHYGTDNKKCLDSSNCTCMFCSK